MWPEIKAWTRAVKEPLAAAANVLLSPMALRAQIGRWKVSHTGPFGTKSATDANWALYIATCVSLGFASSAVETSITTKVSPPRSTVNGLAGPGQPAAQGC